MPQPHTQFPNFPLPQLPTSPRPTYPIPAPTPPLNLKKKFDPVHGTRDKRHEEEIMPKIEIMPGAEPIFFDGSQVRCLVSQGFTGTTRSTR